MTNPVWMRLPIAAGLVALALSGAGPARARADGEASYVVRPHDTLSGIALTLETTVAALLAANHLTATASIRVGQVLAIHGAGTEQPARQWRDRGRRSEHDDRPPALAVRRPAIDGATIYVVLPGDTLSGIGQRAGVSPQAVVAANPGAVLSPLRVGQRVRVPGGNGAAPADNAPSQAAPMPGRDSATVAPSPAPGLVGQSGTIEAMLTAQAQAAGVSVALVKAVAWQESGWRMVTAADGGIGVMQLMPATAAWIGRAVLGAPFNPYDASANIRAGVALLGYYVRVFGGDERLAIAAYNAGLGAVQHGGISDGTARYVANVLALEQRFAS